MSRSNTMSDFVGILLTLDPDDNGCWLWSRRLNHNGYGLFSMNSKQRRAHVLAYAWANEREPRHGEVVRHECDVPACVNPTHLRIGSQADNVADMLERGRHANASKQVCKRGHAFDDANTIVTASGGRSCRTCKDAWTAKRDARRRFERALVTGSVTQGDLFEEFA